MEQPFKITISRFLWDDELPKLKGESNHLQRILGLKAGHHGSQQILVDIAAEVNRLHKKIIQ